MQICHHKNNSSSTDSRNKSGRDFLQKDGLILPHELIAGLGVAQVVQKLYNRERNLKILGNLPLKLARIFKMSIRYVFEFYFPNLCTFTPQREILKFTEEIQYPYHILFITFRSYIINEYSRVSVPIHKE